MSKTEEGGGQGNFWKMSERKQLFFRITSLSDPTGGWVVIQVESAALKLAWKNYSAIELEETCVVWTLETLAYT